jgi:hypothetical protein
VRAPRHFVPQRAGVINGAFAAERGVLRTPRAPEVSDVRALTFCVCLVTTCCTWGREASTFYRHDDRNVFIVTDSDLNRLFHAGGRHLRWRQDGTEVASVSLPDGVPADLDIYAEGADLLFVVAKDATYRADLAAHSLFRENAVARMQARHLGCIRRVGAEPTAVFHGTVDCLGHEGGRSRDPASSHAP